MPLPIKFTFSHDGDIYTAERWDDTQTRITWEPDDDNVCDPGCCLYATNEVEQRIKEGCWVIHENKETRE